MPSDAPSLRPATRADLAATREIYNQALRAGGASLDTRERTAEEQERWFADRDPEAIGRSRLVDELSALGVAPGDLLMLHASVAAVGHVIGGPDQVLQALLDRLGPREP